MRILLHNRSTMNLSDQLVRTLFSLVPSNEVLFTRDDSTFANALIQHRLKAPIVVVNVFSLSDVLALLKISDMLDDLFLIIITDRVDEKIVSKCRELYPRLLITCDTRFELLAEVLRKKLTTD